MFDIMLTGLNVWLKFGGSALTKQLVLHSSQSFSEGLKDLNKVYMICRWNILPLVSLQYITNRVIENQLDLVYKNETVMDISATLLVKVFHLLFFVPERNILVKELQPRKATKKLTLDKSSKSIYNYPKNVFHWH